MKDYNIGNTNLNINPIVNPVNSYHFKSDLNPLSLTLSSNSADTESP